MINRWKFSERTVPLALFVACLLAFGLQIAWLGFYWDDWPGAWFLHRLGPAGFTSVFAEDRPALGWLFILTTSLIGESPTGWQIFGLVTRWLCCLSFWWMLRKLWPGQLKPTTWAALLFAVYPGFKQQHIALTYSHDWIILASFFLSFIVMIYAVSFIQNRQPGDPQASRKTSRWFWPALIVSWALAAYCVFADEYYFGLEALRPVILWLILSRPGRTIVRRVKRTILFELPYVVIAGLFLVWRLLIHVSPRGSVQVFERLSQSPLNGILDLVKTIIADALQTSFGAWAEIFNIPRMLSLGTVPSLLYISALVVGTALALFYLSQFNSPPPDNHLEGKLPSALSWPEIKRWVATLAQNSASRWALQAILLGSLALLSGGIPFWVTYQPIGLVFPWDRFTLPMMFGTSLLLTGLFELIIRPYKSKIVILALVLGLGVGFHVYNSNLYRREWASQKALFWQLSWRAPVIQPGTLILTADLPFIYFSDNSLTAPLNWIYDPAANGTEMQYLLYAVEARLGNRLPALKTGILIEHPYRGLTFQGSTSQTLVIYYNPPGCLKVIDTARHARLPQKGDYLDDLIPLSQTSLVHDSANPTLPSIFGKQPNPDWCFYYEKADLARQTGDWQAVVNWAEQAFQAKPQLYEVNAPEYVPYIEGYAHLGQWERAQNLTLEAYQLTPRMQRMLCYTWNQIAEAMIANTDEQSDAIQAVTQVREKLACTNR